MCCMTCGFYLSIRTISFHKFLKYIASFFLDFWIWARVPRLFPITYLLMHYLLRVIVWYTKKFVHGAVNGRACLLLFENAIICRLVNVWTSSFCHFLVLIVANCGTSFPVHLHIARGGHDHEQTFRYHKHFQPHF